MGDDVSAELPSVLNERDEDKNFYEQLELVRKVHREAGERIRRRCAAQRPRKMVWMTGDLLRD